MAKRFTDNEIWGKDWFLTLDMKSKLLVKYIFDNCDCAGFFTPCYRIMEFQIGAKITEEDILSIKQMEKLEDNLFFVQDFIKFQYGRLSPASKPHLAIIKRLEKYGLSYELINEEMTPKRLRQRLTDKKKREIMARDKYECQYCGSKEFLEIDHIVPLSNGGNNEDSNLITACHNCNFLKKNLPLEEFIKNYKGRINFLETLSKKLQTLKEKEQEQDKEKEKENNSSSLVLSSSCEDQTQKLYGEYQNVCLSNIQHGKLLSLCASQKLLDELLNAFSIAIEVGKEKPYMDALPNAHYERLRSYHNYRMKHPENFREENKASPIKSAVDRWVEQYESEAKG